MTHGNLEKEIQTGKERWEWQDKSWREQQGRKDRGRDARCFNLKVISVSLNALMMFPLGFPQDSLNLTGIITVTVGWHHALIMSMLSLNHEHLQFLRSPFKIASWNCSSDRWRHQGCWEDWLTQHVCFFAVFRNLKVSSFHYWNFIQSFMPAKKQRITLLSCEYCSISLSLWYRALFVTPSYQKSNFTAFCNTDSTVMTLSICHHKKIQMWSWFIYLFFVHDFIQSDWNTAFP